MTTLTFNMQEKMTALFNKYGVFFAFSDEQFLRQRVEGVEYTTFGAGSVVPVNFTATQAAQKNNWTAKLRFYEAINNAKAFFKDDVEPLVAQSPVEVNSDQKTDKQVLVNSPIFKQGEQMAFMF